VVIVLVLGASLTLTNLPLAAKLLIAALGCCGILYVARLPDVIEYWPTESTSEATMRTRAKTCSPEL
jgi:hypothetical protein